MRKIKNRLFLNILIGFFAGMISGFFGAGGGMLLVPYMTEILNQEQRQYYVYFLWYLQAVFFILIKIQSIGL